jgi:hypothetical protein
MAEQIMLNWTDPNSVRKVIKAQAAQAVAWQVFTEQMATWWPLAVYKIGKTNAVDAIMEPRVGGRQVQHKTSCNHRRSALRTHFPCAHQYT